MEFLRKLARLRKSTPKFMIYAEFGRHSLNIIIKQRTLNFCIRILTGKTSKFSHQIYLYMLNSNEQGFKWLNYVQSILNEVGRQDIWVRQSDSVPISTGKIVKQIFLDQFFQTWNSLFNKTLLKVKMMHFSKTIFTLKNI